MRKSIGQLAAACIFAILSTGYAHAQARLTLIDPPAPDAAFDATPKAAKSNRGQTRARDVSPNFAALLALGAQLRANPGTPVQVDLPLFTDRTVVASITGMEESNRGSTRYYGTVLGDPLSSVTIVEARGAFAVNVFIDNLAYQVTFKGNGRYQAVEIDRSVFRDHDGANVPRPPASKDLVEKRPEPTPVATDDGSNIDILVLWSPAARTAAGGVAAIQNEIELAVASTNAAYAASGAIQRLRLVHSQEVAYTEPGTPDLEATLVQMQAGSGAFTGIEALRTTHGGDVVAMFVENGGPFCGIGYFMDTNSAGFAPFAKNVTVRDCATSNQTLAHELGHNMGLDHDTYVSPGPISHPYAHGYINLTHRFRTVMAYVNQCFDTNPFTNCPRVNAFSTPLVNESGSGEPIGDAAFADATRRLNESRVTVANFRAEVGPPSVQFSSDTFNYTEGQATGTVTVTRSGSSSGAVSVQWATSNGSAIAGSDFGVLGNAAQRSGTLNWASGDTAAKTISLVAAAGAQVINDTDVEGAESFTITLSNPSGADIGANGSTTVNIADNDSVIEFQNAGYVLSENGPNIAVRITRTGSIGTAATVTYTTANGTALAGSDFGTAGSGIQRTGVITFAAGSTTRDINLGPIAASTPYISTLNDTAIEGDETFTIALSAPSGGGQLGTNDIATITIQSEDGGIAMAAAGVPVAESAGTAEVTVLRAGSTTGAASIPYTFVNGTASNGTHYTGTPGTLNWAPGDGDPKVISVPIIDNGAVNTNRTFSVVLGTPTGATKGTPGASTVTIQDDDNTLQFSAAAVATNESMASVTLNVSRLGGASAAAGVTWTLVNGTATVGVDTGGPTSGTLNWAGGDSASKSIVIPLVNDALIEGSEAFTVVLSSPTGTGAGLGTATTATVTIADNDAGLNFTSATFNAAEGVASVTLSVERIGNTAGIVGVSWATSNGSAVAGQDFGTNGSPAQRSGVLSWASGVGGVKTFTVPILNDTASESPETFTVTLSAPTGGAALGGTPAATVTIADNESVFELSAPTVVVAENGPNVTIDVTRTGATGLAQTVGFRTTAGTALATTDFTTTAATLSFAAGQTTRTIHIGPVAGPTPRVNVVNDAVVEGPETFTLSLYSPTNGGILGAQSSAVVTINSDERAVSMGAATRSFAEGAGAQTIVVKRSGTPTGALAVNYSFVNGTAQNGVHFNGVNGTVNWTDGDAADKTIPVTILDDGGTNASRTFTVTLSGATAGTTLAAPASTVNTITDNDNSVQFTVATATVAEGTASLNLSVSRTGSNAATADVTWTAVNGTAIAGTDFGVNGNPTAPSGTLHWNAGDSAAKPLSIPILNDTTVEGAKTFTVQLSSPVGANLSIGGNSDVAVTLNDNDAGVVLSAATYEVTEGTASITLTVNRIGPATAAATVQWATSNGTATAGQDFGTAGSPAQRSGTLSWLAGQATAKTFVIPVINDPNNEGDETFTVTLANPSASVVLGTPNVATVTIHDNDIPPQSTLQFSQPKYLVLENGASVNLTVNRVDAGGGFALPATVNYATVPGTALATSDYTTKTGTLTWAGGDNAPKVINVLIVNNTTPEATEGFKVTLANATPGTGIGTPEAGVTVVDDDEAFPLDGAIPAGWVVAAGADTGWHVSNDAGSFEGVHSLRSDQVDDGESAGIEVTDTFTAGTLSFRVKVSSEANFDFVRFYVDGVEQGAWSGTAVAGWQVFSMPLTAGVHTLRWVYEKDGSVSVGSDAAWIDGFTLGAAAPPSGKGG